MVLFTCFFAAGTVRAENILIDMVTVGNAGNAAFTTGFGAVGYEYQIGKYEVTNGQYAAFLNAVAADDTNGLYNPLMESGWNGIGGIVQEGSAGSHTYSARVGRENRPVIYVDWCDSLRFMNWLHNGQLAGVQDGGTTENGAYDLAAGALAVRNPDARFFLPSEDEWYKAAYYKGGGTDAGYWEFPTQSDMAPSSEPPPGSGGSNGSANYYNGGFAVGDPDYLADVGSYLTSDSPYGTYDQGGNVWEWNESLMPLDFRGLRGGSLFSLSQDLQASNRVNYDPLTEYNDVGFRVGAVVPEPASLVMLLCGAGFLVFWQRALWQWRRRR